MKKILKFLLKLDLWLYPLKKPDDWRKYEARKKLKIK
jgi:hypothetical protein